MRKESSVSRFADREFRFVDPNKVTDGAGGEVGDAFWDTHTPVNEVYVSGR